jgi:hypothetical protein
MQTNLKPKETMSNTQNTLIVKLPYPLRHLLPEIKSRGGRFDSATKTWALSDTTENRLLANQLSAAQPPPPTASPEERVRNIATTTVELLNALKLGHFILGTTTLDRVVIEKIPA